MTDGPDVRPEDALQVAQRALAKVQEQEQTISELQERVAALEAAQPDRSEYDDLDRETKVGMVREHLVERAQDQHGRAAIDYNGVKWEVFDGEPSPDYCYTLMELAAEAGGFDLRDPNNGNRELVVDIGATKPELGFSRTNKDSVKGGR
jgi:hypothetical protein